VKFLTAQELPGNVRQLENLCHWLTVMAPGQTVEINDLPAELRGESRGAAEQSWATLLEREVENALNRGESGIIDGLTESFERALIKRALAHTGGRRIEAAQLLGLGRNTLTRKIRELGMENESSEPN
jgi:two-component system nitrogen regulation response regulator GlnG